MMVGEGNSVPDAIGDNNHFSARSHDAVGRHDAGDLVEVLVVSEHDGPDSAGAAADDDVGEREDYPRAVELPCRALDVGPKTRVGRDMQHHIPAFLKSLQQFRFAQAARHFGTHDIARHKVADFCDGEQFAQGIFAVPRGADIPTAIDEDG